MTPTTIDTIISNKSSNTLDPMVAIQYVFTKQQCSIQGLEYQDDATVQLLYSIAQDPLSNQIRKEDETVDALVNVCQETKNQFKRIHGALEDVDGPVSKMAQKYASAGFVYSDACLRKYTQDPIIDSVAMSEPISLPDGVMGQIGRTAPILPSLPPPKKND